MSEFGTIASINVSRGGVPKRPVFRAWISVNGVEGDRQADLRHHGGPMRAVCLYSLDRIAALHREGHPITPGSAGENLTIEGMDWERVTPGVRLKAGDAVLEITAFTNPCRKIRNSFLDQKFNRIAQHLFPGWSRVYARVLREGDVRPGDRVEIHVDASPEP